MVATWLIAAAGLIVGCAESPAPPPASIGVSQPLADDDLRNQLDEVLDFTYHQRHLNTDDHAAWQILHGALTYKRQFMVRDGGELVSAVDHVLQGGQMRGWTMRRGVLLDNDTDGQERHGIKAILEEGSKTGQGHADQWLAVLAQCELAPEQTIELFGDEFTMSDWVAQVQYDVPNNLQREYSWTLIGLTTYLPTSAEWTAADGATWSIERLIAIEAEQDLGASACGGTHRLIGMSMALNQHLAEGGKIEGVWQDADRRIRETVEITRQYQNENGGFSSQYFQRPGSSPDLARTLSTTGHILEFLAISLTDEQLREPWVQRAVARLCDVFRKTMQTDLECGSLYHATHGLALYRERVYGPRDYSQPRPSEESTAQR